MTRKEQTKALGAARLAIDEIDSAVLGLLNRRAKLSLEIGKIKLASDESGAMPVYDPVREKVLLSRLDSMNPGPLSADQVRAIWTEIISASRALQRPAHAAYLGPEGTFSHHAAIGFLGTSVRLLPCESFEEIFRQGTSGSCEYGVLPLENSLRGTVVQNYDLFWRYGASILAESSLRVSHSLLSREHGLGSIGVIYSHAQALAQCSKWLRAFCPAAKVVPADSTAAAAEKTAGEPGTACVGHVCLAGSHGLNVLASAIEDNPGNRTRFVLIGPADPRPAPRPGADKTSLMFTLPDSPGALSSVLKALADDGVNMRKLESRPLEDGHWHYIFFADVDGDLLAPGHSGTLERLKKICLSLRVLGSYPSNSFGDKP